jgi:nucleoporin SEH1
MLCFDQQIGLPTLIEADCVHDIAYDFYGTRLALCTSSLRISIFSAPPGGQGEDGDGAAWTETARMDKAHAGPIWRLSWGHPELGEPLASCSEDRNVTIWYMGGSGSADGGGRFAAPGALPRWQSRANLSCDGPVMDVRFAPAPLGLKLAACTADGKAKVFECVNSLDYRAWDKPEDLETLSRPGGAGSAAASSVSASASGAAAAAAPKASIAGCISAALDWMPVPFGGGSDERCEALAVAGRGGRLAIWAKEKTAAGAGKWKELASAEAHPVKEGGVRDVAWCPNLCRLYEVVATCGGGAALWRVDFNTSEDESVTGDDQSEDGRKETSTTAVCQLQLLKKLIPWEDQACLVWRCSWNVTGTTLVLCPEDGGISVWKANATCEWREAAPAAYVPHRRHTRGGRKEPPSGAASWVSNPRRLLVGALGAAPATCSGRTPEVGAGRLPAAGVGAARWSTAATLGPCPAAASAHGGSSLARRCLALGALWVSSRAAVWRGADRPTPLAFGLGAPRLLQQRSQGSRHCDCRRSG